MYKFKHFTEDDNEAIVAFMKKYSFALIIGVDDSEWSAGNAQTRYPVATHVPLEIKQIDGRFFFTGHIMKNSDHHKAFLTNENVLVIFNGPHCYVSASWYTTPDVASTWNYMAVHAKGKIKFGDEPQTRKVVEALTNKYETHDSPAAFNKLSNEYVDRLVKAIIAFTIEVESFDNVFKLSQNHNKETRQNIIDHLRKNGSDNENAIAAEMELRLGLQKQ